jgi:hypothetical protein
VRVGDDIDEREVDDFGFDSDSLLQAESRTTAMSVNARFWLLRLI